MGWAARVRRKRACRHNCLLKVERTADELHEHEVVGHPKGVGPAYPDPEPSSVPALESHPAGGLMAALLTSPLAVVRRNRR